jgi:hypothetical protein
VVSAPPAEGRLESGLRGLEMGQQVGVELVSTDVAGGFIDFVLVDGKAKPEDEAVNAPAASAAIGRLQYPILRVR